MEKGQEAREKNEQGEELEQIKLITTNAIVNGLDGRVDATALKEQLNGIVEEEGRASITATNSPWIVKGIKTGSYYTISKDGQVEAVDGVAFTNKNVKVKPGKTFELDLINITGEALTITPATSNGITMTLGQNNKVTITTASTIQVGTTASFTATAGTASDTCNVEVVYDKAGAINKLIGNNVNYSVTYTENNTDTTIDKWQVFYADENNGEVFIISEDILETNTYIGGTNTTSNAPAYSAGAASNSLAEGTYGRKYNSKWFEVEGMPDAAKDTNGNPNNNAKTVAYLCDSTNANWTKYAKGAFKDGKSVTTNAPNGTYAVGGPTIELLYESVKIKYSYSINGTLSPTAMGYNKPFKDNITTPYLAQYTTSAGLKANGYWWLASPYDYYGGRNNLARFTYSDNGKVDYANYKLTGSDYGVRPLISIPLDAFDTDWIVQPTTNP